MKTIILNHYYPHLTEPITLENLPPILSPKVQDKRKREIESCLFEVFISWEGVTSASAPTRAIPARTPTAPNSRS